MHRWCKDSYRCHPRSCANHLSDWHQKAPIQMKTLLLRAWHSQYLVSSYLKSPISASAQR
uniref:Uncharacterized protein n=1 Tax=Physcomitrium patens TaxID=3218 RepID=A0A2K1KGR5_PHYPA|nr:hypothetical protein PHYPA_009346 [Physcomitrium patens]